MDIKRVIDILNILNMEQQRPLHFTKEEQNIAVQLAIGALKNQLSKKVEVTSNLETYCPHCTDRALDELKFIGEWMAIETSKREYESEEVKTLSSALIYLREYIKKDNRSTDSQLNKLLKLSIDNPGLRIIAMVDEEIVCSNEYSRWMASVGDSRIDEYYMDDERMYFKSDTDELEEKYSENIWLDDEEISDEDLEKETEERIKHIPWKKAIFLNINLP